MNLKKICCTAFLCCLLAACLNLGFAHAQTVTGSITGTVTDPSGAVIPGAHVIAKNVDTSVQSETNTNSDGAYTIRFLPIGNYTVTVQANGFGAQTFPSFALEVDQTAKFNAKLTVGSATANVEVKGEVAPILDTTDATLASTFTANQLANLPLNGGNFAQVAEFAPGVVATPNGFSGGVAIERDTSFSSTVAVAGNRDQENDYTLEGADNNEPQQNLIAYNPAVEALGEVRLVNANAGVAFGNANGGSIVSVLKSGTDKYHGSAYIYLQNQNLDANSWGNKDQTPVEPKTPFSQTKFGGTLGGPIWRSKKLFFFGDYEGFRLHTGGLSNNSVFPAAWRQGDFSSLLTPPTINGTPAYSPIQLYNSQNNYAPYVNDQVPIVNPVATYIFAHPNVYPLPNATPLDGLMQNNLQEPQKSFTVDNQYDIKIDWTPGTSNQFSAFYSASRSYDGASQPILSTFPPLNIYPTKLGGGTWIHTFSNAIVNQARFGFTRVRWDQGIPTDPSGLFGLTGDAVVGIPFIGPQPYVGFSQQSFGATNIGTTAGVGIVRDNTFKYSDALTWQLGKHLLSFGGDARRYQQNYVNTGNTGFSGFLGNFNYTGIFTGNPNVNPVTNAVLSTGYAPADFAQDFVDSNGLSSGGDLIGNRQWRVGLYFEDDWKITPSLTLNLGLRWEYDQPWYEAHNKTANIVFQDGTPVVEYAGSVPALANPGSIVCPTRACYNANWKQFMPRIGFAEQVTPRIVIRGGYSATSFLEGDNFNQRLTSSPPFVLFTDTTVLSTPTPTNGGSPLSVQNGFSPQFNGQGSQTYSVWPQNQQPAYVNQFNLTTEFALTNTLSLSVGYLGETGQHLSAYSYPNQWTIQQANIFSLLPAAVQNNQSEWPASLNTAYSSIPGVGINSTGVLLTGSNGMMNYNGLLMSLRQRTHYGLEFTANYTYSKSLANETQGNYGNPPSDSYDLSKDYGPANTDVRHNVTFNGVYTIPYGRGQAHGKDLNLPLDLLLGGWKLSATLVNYTGEPISISGPNNTGINGVTARANQYRHFKFVHRSISAWWGTDPSVKDFVGGIDQCTIINSDNGVCAYGPESATPGELAYGTAASNTERLPGYRQVDAALFKEFHIYGGQALGFRANVYNLFNISSYGTPNTNIQSAEIGQITSVNSPPREIELSAHYTF